MSFLVEQKIGKHIYVYETQSYWDKDKKQSRQKRRYIGKKDIVSGETTTPRKTKRAEQVQDYGHVYLAKHIAKQIGLDECIKEVFADNAEEISHLMYHQVLEASPLYMQKSWAEGVYVPKTACIPSQKISSLLASIGESENKPFDFFKAWIKKQKDLDGAWLDITSVSTYSNNLDFAEWGYNRDKESLPQINLGYLLGYPSQLPLFYQAYPGSINDVITIKNTIKFAKNFGVKINNLVMDRGFYSLANIKELSSNKFNFIIPLPSTIKEVKNILQQSKESLKNTNSFCQNGKIMFYWNTSVQLDGIDLKICVYLDEKKRALELENFMGYLHELEDKFKQITFESQDQASVYINDNWNKYAKFYQVITQNKKIILERNNVAISDNIAKFGKMILATNNSNLDHESMIALYRQRDGIEKAFDVMKNDLHEYRLRTSTNKTTNGKIFVTFLSVILYSALLQLMRPSLIKKFTVAEVFSELKKIRAVKLDDAECYLTEISKTQRLIFKELGIPVPEAPSY